jgi:hypothetical protein
MKTIVDRLSKVRIPAPRSHHHIPPQISKHIYLDAEQSGKLIFRVENSLVKIKTFYTGLIPRFGQSTRP